MTPILDEVIELEELILFAVDVDVSGSAFCNNHREFNCGLGGTVGINKK